MDKKNWKTESNTNRHHPSRPHLEPPTLWSAQERYHITENPFPSAKTHIQHRIPLKPRTTNRKARLKDPRNETENYSTNQPGYPQSPCKSGAPRFPKPAFRFEFAKIPTSQLRRFLQFQAKKDPKRLRKSEITGAKKGFSRSHSWLCTQMYQKVEPGKFAGKQCGIRFLFPQESIWRSNFLIFHHKSRFYISPKYIYDAFLYLFIKFFFQKKKQF